MGEVKKAIMSVSKDKVPWLDAFTAHIFHAYWSFLKNEIHAMVEEIGATTYVLWLLMQASHFYSEKGVGEWSLWIFSYRILQCIYRIIIKVISNSLKAINLSLEILDNSAISRVIIHYLKNQLW